MAQRPDPGVTRYENSAGEIRWRVTYDLPPGPDGERRRTVAVLHDHRRRQLEERIAAGPGWSTNEQDHDLVFTRPDGTAIPPKRASQQFTRQVDAAGLPRIGVHGLRHT